MITFRKLCAVFLVLLLAGSMALAEEDLHWKVATTFYAIASYADLRTSDTLLNEGRFRETNPLYGDHPSDMRLYGQGAVVTAGAWYGISALKKKKRKTALVILWTLTAVRTAGAVHNRQLD